ncbi:Cof-type HAD-IIB family hydrolase [Vibrio agarivorans]|uniref:Cof-type HAD-IIB family hydrolase n=1 Tax=Vibrio agarivorans TaxID=153622 RepID=UPI00222FD6CA|nr:Cof-type HAD-IIB family hydrolase [Vibrio agarivorans]MDN3661891.1 Cof-type HAD-IIB family hydrolase [Vibrio agarivorans]
MNAKTPYSIVASDLDGTLLAPNHQLSDYTKKTLKTLSEQGFTFIFATGRHHIDVAGIRQNVGIPAYMITSNGARVHDQNDELMYSNNVPSSLVQKVIDLAKDDDSLFIHLYRNEEWMLNKHDATLAKFHDESGFSYQIFDTNSAPTEGIAKIFFTQTENDHEYLVTLEDKLNQLFGDELNVAFSTPWCLEVMAADVSKGEALKVVAESLGKSLQDCIAFGDGMNDAEMLTMAGKGLVMADAHIKVKQALPHNEIIGSNADDAVARYLKEQLLT